MTFWENKYEFIIRKNITSKKTGFTNDVTISTICIVDMAKCR